MFESLADDEVAIRVDLIATFVAFRINPYGVVAILRSRYHEHAEFIQSGHHPDQSFDLWLSTLMSDMDQSKWRHMESGVVSLSSEVAPFRGKWA